MSRLRSTRTDKGAHDGPWVVAALTATAVLTGFIDAIAGGGGLIMMPALLFAGVPPIEALGTNKLQSMFGTATALRNFAAKGLVDWRAHKGTIACVFIGASVGVIAVQAIDPGALLLIIPLLLIAVALYVIASPRMDDEAAHERIPAGGYAPSRAPSVPMTVSSGRVPGASSPPAWSACAGSA